MTTTQKLIAALIIASGSALATLPALAQPGGGCTGMGPMGGERMQGRMADRMKQHQQQLHDALKLNPDQEKAWTKFQESSPFGKQEQRTKAADWDKLSAPERADRMLELQRQHQEAMTQHVAALKEFYGQLTPEQKKTFDEQHSQRRGGRRGQGPQQGQGPAPTK